MSHPFTHKKPPFRKLRGYAFDPSLSHNPETSSINTIVYRVPWERLDPGPIGEYVEVIDYDPTVKKFYRPVDLYDDYILSEDGLDPSESDPQFHQQMVYAVAMTTIRNFERALGRKIIWRPYLIAKEGHYENYVPRLRLYPHAMREANAYYSQLKTAILFGYFSSAPAEGIAQVPGSLVFTCLSHDIIAHETTHAILDSIFPTYNEATNPDVLAFHEAFADIVALFQHFTFPEVLVHQIGKTRGNLTAQNLLGQLAQEFAAATGNYGSLRDALGSVNPATGVWHATVPNPKDYQTIMEPHARGSILVAAVFDAFITIYNSRVEDLTRIAMASGGNLQTELHPDIVRRMATEASRAAGEVLSKCIRALDFCPPLDITFGDFLRAIISADVEANPVDSGNHRLAFINAFRSRGIYPEKMTTLTENSLRYPVLNIGYDTAVDSDTRQLYTINEFLRDFGNDIKYIHDRKKIYDITRAYIGGAYGMHSKKIVGLHSRLNSMPFNDSGLTRLTGLAFMKGYEKMGIRASAKYPGPSYQIVSLALISKSIVSEGQIRHGGIHTFYAEPGGGFTRSINHVVMMIVQRCGVEYKDGQLLRHFLPSSNPFSNVDANGNPLGENCFIFKGGCTFIYDLDTQLLKYCISKPIIDYESMALGKLQVNQRRLLGEYNFRTAFTEFGLGEFAAYFTNKSITEPFAFLHRNE